MQVGKPRNHQPNQCRCDVQSYQKLASADQITDNVPKSEIRVVAFGAANIRAMRGRSFGPTESIYKRLRQVRGIHVIKVDEYLTSQKCCRCGHQLNKVYRPAQEDQPQASPRPMEGVPDPPCNAPPSTRITRHIHGVLQCSNSSCGTIDGSSRRNPTWWNRDVNAAINIANVLVHMLVHGEHSRPQALMRPTSHNPSIVRNDQKISL